VIKYYPDTDGWFGKDDKAWPVAFHGIRNPTASIISNIAIMGLKVCPSNYGGRNIYAD
jgi:hypothetical protein